MTKILDIAKYFEFDNYPIIKDEINFSYQLNNVGTYHRCLIVYNIKYKRIGISDYYFDKKTREIINKDPLKQLNNFRDFLIKRFKLTTKDILGCWEITFIDSNPKLFISL